MDPLTDLTENLREEAETFRRRGIEREADLLESVAEDVEIALHAFRTERLTVAEAAAESGYSPKRLRELVREGKLPDERPDGSRAEIRIRRCDLPRKPCAQADADPDVDRIAARILSGRA